MTHENQNCNHKYPTDYRYAAKHPGRALCCCLAIFLLLAGITLLTLYLVYRPHKPYFTVASVIVLNLTTTTTTTSAPPPSVSAAMQFTIITTNPNHRVSILYDRLSAYVSYHNQMITQPVALPPLFHEKHTRVEMAPVLGGAVGGGCGVCGGGGGGGGVMPVAPEVAYGLGMDEEYGVVGLSLVLLGKIRWKAAGITTGRYGIYVKCDILIRLRKVFQLLGSMHCYVKVYEGNDNPRRVSKGLSEQKT
ncbi:hypothetical protein C3L33_04924, partial [Rhododendron williamsianum]